MLLLLAESNCCSLAPLTTKMVPVIRFGMHGELELDLALVLWVDLEDLALDAVVRLTQHKGELWGTAPPPCRKS